MTAPETFGSAPSGTAPWCLSYADTTRNASLNAARLAITDGCVGVQSVSEVGRPAGADRALRVSGLVGPEPPGLLLEGPSWTPGDRPGTGVSWTLDLATGTVRHEIDTGTARLETLRWSVAGEPGVQAYLAPEPQPGEPPCEAPPPSVLVGADHTVAVTVATDRVVGGQLLRIASTATGAERHRVLADATDRAERLIARDPGDLLGEQRRRWQERWRGCSVTIEGDPAAEIRTRYALYHLLSLTDHGAELPIGARGLTGEAYGGHVFWDADVFVLPSLATVAPSAARAMVEYRLRRLASARAAADEAGLAGARFPWESARSGRDVTPRSGVTATGETVPILTGQQELHIGADIVWALMAYRELTGDDAVLEAGGAELCAEVARYWVAVIDDGPDGRGHIADVIGPDEYHETVDDNAYTNIMAAWTLRQASQLAADGHLPGVDEVERTGWLRAATGLVTGYDPSSGRHEQFGGYDQLDPIMAASIAPVPFAADLLLGRELVQRSQLIKQADVLMAHQLVPDELPPGSLERDLSFYLPRTAHGSSLSPAVHASVLARTGRADHAADLYRIALGIDVDDLTRTGAGGIHYANLGGIWQALITGFLGVRPGRCGLVVDPKLPSGWSRVLIQCHYGGANVQVEATQSEVTVASDRPLTFAASGPDAAITTDRFRLVRSVAEKGWVHP